MSAPSKFFAILSPHFRSPEADFERFSCQASATLDAIEALLTSQGGTSIGVLEGLLGIGRSYATGGTDGLVEERAPCGRGPWGGPPVFGCGKISCNYFAPTVTNPGTDGVRQDGWGAPGPWVL